jgi:hypothetical protein
MCNIGLFYFDDANILRHAKELASTSFGAPVKDCVITVCLFAILLLSFFLPVNLSPDPPLLSIFIII